MSRSTPIRLAALAALLFALTLLATHVRNDKVEPPQASSVQVVQIMVPVEIIEAGEDPARVEIRVAR
ncbi:MAG: hypothetical protein AAGI48_11515 [Verrucomicrobiota bacterium]